MLAIINISDELLLTVLSIIGTLFFTYIFYRLQKRDVASARTERVKRAKEELLDAIESCIINKQQVSEGFVYNLLAASEREYQVGMKDTCTPTTLLQDLALRLQKGRHLDIDQKREYSSQIEQTINTIEERHNEVPEEAKELIELVDVLEDAVQNDEKQKGVETITLLKEKLIKAPVPARVEYTTVLERGELITSLVTGISIIIAILALIKVYTGPSAEIFYVLALILSGAIILIIVVTIMKKWIEK